MDYEKVVIANLLQGTLATYPNELSRVPNPQSFKLNSKLKYLFGKTFNDQVINLKRIVITCKMRTLKCSSSYVFIKSDFLSAMFSTSVKLLCKWMWKYDGISQRIIQHYLPPILYKFLKRMFPLMKLIVADFFLKSWNCFHWWSCKCK